MDFKEKGKEYTSARRGDKYLPLPHGQNNALQKTVNRLEM